MKRKGSVSMRTANFFEICTSIVFLAGIAASAPAQTAEPKTREIVIEEAQPRRSAPCSRTFRARLNG
jgi:hypothetical protein